MTLNGQANGVYLSVKSHITVNYFQRLIDRNLETNVEDGLELLKEAALERGGGTIQCYENMLLSMIENSSSAICRRLSYEALLLIIRQNPKKCFHLYEPMMAALGNLTLFGSHFH
jgi:hypothetical protein